MADDGRRVESAAELVERYAAGERDFARADLRDADLSDADLSDAELTGADLYGANLYGANLRDADLSGADLSGANVGGAELDETTLANVSLGPFAEATPRVVHSGRSSIDDRAIALSLRAPGLREFLVGTGMNATLVDYTIDALKSLDPNELFSAMHTVFISYGGPDEAFAKRLRDGMHQQGVHTFFAPDDAIGGKPIRKVIHRGINQHDRTIAVLSKQSLGPDRKTGKLRGYFYTELRKILDREAKLGVEGLLVPLTLDRYVFEKWEPPDPEVKDAILSRVVVNFIPAVTRRGNVNNEPDFDAAVGRLLRALRKEEVGS